MKHGNVWNPLDTFFCVQYILVMHSTFLPRPPFLHTGNGIAAAKSVFFICIFCFFFFRFFEHESIDMSELTDRFWGNITFIRFDAAPMYKSDNAIYRDLESQTDHIFFAMWSVGIIYRWIFSVERWSFCKFYWHIQMENFKWWEFYVSEFLCIRWCAGLLLGRCSELVSRTKAEWKFCLGCLIFRNWSWYEMLD